MVNPNRIIRFDDKYEPLIESEKSAEIRAYKNVLINNLSIKLAREFASLAEVANGFASDLNRHITYLDGERIHSPYPNYSGGVAKFLMFTERAVADYHALTTLFLEINYWDGGCIQPIKNLDRKNHE
jgi:hypothetical protein